MPIVQRMRADREIRQDPPLSHLPRRFTPCHISLERPACHAPHALAQMPIHSDPGLLKERIEKLFRSSRSGQQLREYRRRDYQCASRLFT